MTRVLVTNDDGVGAPGIGPLACALEADGIDVVVAAPLDDMSGAGAAFGSFDGRDELVLEEHRIEGLETDQAFGIKGAPGRCVMAATLGAFGEPVGLVVAGINPGVNTGRTVLHSGTVGAALTAANLGGVGLAVSLAWSDTGEYHWETAASIARRSLPWMRTLPAKTAINLNVPNLPLAEVLGVRQATLAPFGAVRSALIEDGPLRYTYAFQEVTETMPEGSDTALITQGYASVTALSLPQAIEPPPGMVEAFS